MFDIYKLEVLEIPTNVPVARLDEDDEVYRTQNEKYAAILAEIERANARLQPVLVGTASIEKSEVLAEYLKKNGYKQIDFGSQSAMEKLYAAARAGKPAKLFAVLNARFHEQEAYIVAEAGVPGAITIASFPRRCVRNTGPCRRVRSSTKSKPSLRKVRVSPSPGKPRDPEGSGARLECIDMPHEMDVLKHDPTTSGVEPEPLSVELRSRCRNGRLVHWIPDWNHRIAPTSPTPSRKMP